MVKNMKKYTGNNYDATLNTRDIVNKISSYVNSNYSNDKFEIEVMNIDSFMPTIFLKLIPINTNMYMTVDEFKSYVDKTNNSLFNVAKNLKERKLLKSSWRSSKSELVSAYSKAFRYHDTSCLVKSTKLTKIINDVDNLVSSYQQQIIYDNYQTEINFLFGGCELAA